MVQLSTDYVVAGEEREPYPADAPVAPATAYGRTKAAGEWAVRAECPRSWVVRTAWLYGAHGKNFPATMQRLAGERERLTVVADQVGQPTWTVDLAEGLLRIVDAWRAVRHLARHGRRGSARGSSWPGRCSRSSGSTPSGSRRSRPTSSRCRRRGRPTACSSHDMWARGGARAAAALARRPAPGRTDRAGNLSDHAPGRSP